MKTRNKVLLSVALIALIGVVTAFNVNIQGAIVNATTGFQFNGAAPSGHLLCGNGAEYVDASTCGASAFYQTMENTGTPVSPQRAALNFTNNFFVSDVSGATLVQLAATITSTAANANAVGGVALAGLCQTGGAGCPGVSGTLNDVTGSRSFGSTFTNSGTTAIFVSGYGVTTTGGDTSQVDCTSGGIGVWGNQANATVVGGHDGFAFMVVPGASYSCSTSGTTAVTLGKWTEFVY